LDAPFLILVGFCLAFVSLLIAARMGSAGLPTRRVVLLIAELWAAFAIWVGVLWAAATRVGLQTGAHGPLEATLLVRRAAEMGGPERILMALSLLLAIAVFMHLLWALHRGMRGAGGE